jgi:hypothetical protein
LNRGLSYRGAAALLVVCCANGLTAQETDVDQSTDPLDEMVSANMANAPVIPYAAFDLKQKYLFSLNEMAGPTQWIGFAVHAAMDQFDKAPIAWGNGVGGFGVRLANHFGRSFFNENIAFGVRAFDHEDPRYIRRGEGSKWKRAEYAATRTLLARKDDGGWMPAYSRFIADYSTPFLAQTWRPERFSARRGFRQGTVAIGMGLGSNLWEEFWPDLKKRARNTSKRLSDRFSGVR